MNIGFAYDGDPLVVQQRIGSARHNAQLALQGVPALNRTGIAVVFLNQALHGNGQAGNVCQLLIVDLDFHLFAAIGNRRVDFLAVGNGFFDLGSQLRQGNGRKLDIEFFKQLALVAHRGPEVIRTRADLQNADILKGLYHVADCKEILDTAFKDRVIQAAVCHISKRYAEAAQHLASGKQTALGITQADAVRLGTLIQRPPQQHRHAQFLGKAGALVLGAEVAVRQEQTVNLGSLEFFHNLQAVIFIVE